MSCVTKVQDELTKNQRETDKELISGFTLQIKNADGTVAKFCPVRLFEKYLNALGKNVEYLWQRPKRKIPKKNSDEPWCIKKQVGHNTHEKFMGKLSKDAELIKHYMDHCIG